MKPINWGSLEYNFKLEATTSTPEYPLQVQYPHLESTYLITGRFGSSLPSSLKNERIKGSLVDQQFFFGP